MGLYVTFQMAEVTVSRQMFQENPDADRPAEGAATLPNEGLWGRKARNMIGRGSVMKANDQVPAPQTKVTRGFHCPGQPSRAQANLVATQAQRWPKSRHDPLGIRGMSD